MAKNKTIQMLPEPEQQIEEIDLNAKLYPITEYVDESGKVVVPLRGTYETGEGDGNNEFGISAIEYEGYRNFKRRTRLVSWNELVEADRREREILDLNRRIFPEPQKGGHTTVWDHEFIPHTKVASLLTQNPVVTSTTNRRTGFTEDGCGEDKTKHYSPAYHPISFRPDYEYWNEDRYLAIQSLKKGQSIDTYDLMEPLVFKCDITGRLASSHIVYINPNNSQTYVWCRRCWEKNADWPWHRIKDHEMLEEIGFELGIDLIRYRKAETDDQILELVQDNPGGINRYQIGKLLGMSKDMVKRGVARLKRKHLVRTKTVKKAVCIYPIFDEMGKDLLE